MPPRGFVDIGYRGSRHTSAIPRKITAPGPSALLHRPLSGAFDSLPDPIDQGFPLVTLGYDSSARFAGLNNLHEDSS